MHAPRTSIIVALSVDHQAYTQVNLIPTVRYYAVLNDLERSLIQV